MATLINQALTASKPPAKTKNAAPPTNKLPVAKQAAKNTQNKAAEQQYKSRLHQVIAQQKKYPARAKRKQEEGTVTVSFVIYANGSIQNLKIVRSSGSDSLDQAAINTVKQISNRLPFPAEINRKQWQLTLPLVYRLR